VVALVELVVDYQTVVTGDRVAALVVGVETLQLEREQAVVLAVVPEAAAAEEQQGTWGLVVLEVLVTPEQARKQDFRALFMGLAVEAEAVLTQQQLRLVEPDLLVYFMSCGSALAYKFTKSFNTLFVHNV
jgi:hypothetical protein